MSESKTKEERERVIVAVLADIAGEMLGAGATWEVVRRSLVHTALLNWRVDEAEAGVLADRAITLARRGEGGRSEGGGLR
ncbi:MAG: hypothetical protein QW688_08310 [Thermoprotei archaeon]